MSKIPYTLHPEKFENADVSVVFPVSVRSNAPQIFHGKVEMVIPPASGVLLAFDVKF